MITLRDDHRGTVAMFCFVLIVLRRRVLRSKHKNVVLECGAQRGFSVSKSSRIFPAKTPISVENPLTRKTNKNVPFVASVCSFFFCFVLFCFVLFIFC